MQGSKRIEFHPWMGYFGLCAVVLMNGTFLFLATISLAHNASQNVIYGNGPFISAGYGVTLSLTITFVLGFAALVVYAMRCKRSLAQWFMVTVPGVVVLFMCLVASGFNYAAFLAIIGALTFAGFVSLVHARWLEKLGTTPVTAAVAPTSRSTDRQNGHHRSKQRSRARVAAVR